MQQTPNNGQRIDLETWERRELFEFFKTFTDPYHSVCVRIDCTETFRFAKKERLSVFLSLVHRSMIAANKIDNWKTRIVKGEPWKFQVIRAGSAVGRENGTIGFADYAFAENIHEFVAKASVEVERVKGRNDLERRPDLDLVRYSVLPWLDFTSLTHAMNATAPDSAPRITFGKITERDGRNTMPVAIHVHHALADGLHVGQFVEVFEKLLAVPEANGV